MITNKMKTGVELIAEEREKQIKKHGYNVSHDYDYKDKELLYAALAYLKQSIFGNALQTESYAFEDWPWDMKYWHNDGYIENLKKAGALIAAELDRVNVV